MTNWKELDGTVLPVKPRKDFVRWRALTATFVTCVALAGLDTIFSFSGTRWTFDDWRLKPTEKPFQWSQITPQKHLEFHKCYYGFECAKLSLPLDYFKGTYPNDTVSIAIAKLPARVPVDDPRYGGPILINPGGPGGAGASFAVMIGKQLQIIVDSGTETGLIPAKYFDIIGFDPRGIGETEPHAECMPDVPSVWSWNMRENNEGILGSSDAALGRLWAMTHAFGEACKQSADEDGDSHSKDYMPTTSVAHGDPDIKEYMSTASVARDMLEIAERHAEYIAKQVEQLSTDKKNPTATYTPGNAKLQYWGFSYGTYLGSTFASMFPDRVGRLILDGVVSSYDYNHSLGNGSLTDTEKAMKMFYTSCHKLGPEDCPLATTNGTVKDIEDRFQKIIQSLYHRPLIINSGDGPEILTYSDVKQIIFSSLYAPKFSYPFVAELLSAIESGYGAILDQLSFAYRNGHIYHCPVKGVKEPPMQTVTPTMAVLCGDGIDQSHVNIDGFVEYWNLLDSMSPSGGSIWSTLMMRCAAWKIRAKYTFQGPFGANTSHPILFLSNTADPVTPLRSGRIMHNMFPGSSIVVGDHAGHCSIAEPNPCMLSYVRAYFQTGWAPRLETVCVPPASPWSLNSTDPKSPFYDPSLGSANVVADEEKECDRDQYKLQKAARELQRFVVQSDIFGAQKMFGGEKLSNAMEALQSWV